MKKIIAAVIVGAALCILNVVFIVCRLPWGAVAGNIIIFGLLVACIFWLRTQKRLLEFLSAQTKPLKKAEATEKNRILEKRIELSIFENQINPHFLYNTLDSIRGEALRNGQKDIAVMLEKLSRFFRYCISSKGRIVKLSEEMHNVQDYYYIQRYRFGDRIELITEIENDEVLEYYIPKITIQPIVENSIAHGIETSGRKGTVVIRIGATDQKVYIHIMDNGKGMSLEELERMNERLKNNQVEVRATDHKHTGIAVQNVNSRIRLCFGDEFGLHYRSILGEGTDVTIVLPLINDFSRGTFERKLQELM